MVERGSSAATALVMTVTAQGRVTLEIGAGAARGWHLRLHLRVGQRVVAAALDGGDVAWQTLAPGHAAAWPFAGRGAPPPPHAGPIAEIALPAAGRAPRTLVLQHKRLPAGFPAEQPTYDQSGVCHEQRIQP